VFQRRAGQWKRVVVVPGHEDEGAVGPRILSLGISRQGILVGLRQGLWVLTGKGAPSIGRVSLARLPVRALTVSRDGLRTWVGQGRWLWRGHGRRFTRVGRCPGGPWRALAAHPYLRGVVAGSDGRRVYRSTDGGRSFRALRIQAGGAPVVGVAYSVRRPRVSLLVLTRRQLIELRRGRRARPGPLSPALVLGAQRKAGADWVLGAGLFGATGPRGSYRPRSLGLRGGLVRDMSSDWGDPAGVWCVTGAGVFRLLRRVLRLRRSAGCRLGDVPTLGRRGVWRPAHWAPRLALRFRVDRRARIRLRGVRPQLKRYHRWQWKIFVTLRWPMELGTAAVSAQQRLIASARWRRQARVRQRRLDHCRQTAVSSPIGSDLWFEGEIIRALLGRADNHKE